MKTLLNELELADAVAVEPRFRPAEALAVATGVVCAFSFRSTAASNLESAAALRLLSAPTPVIALVEVLFVVTVCTSAVD